jgi:transcriptional antiterminator RfaH
MNSQIDYLEESALLSSAGGKPWHIALTQPQSEAIASAHLTRLRYKWCYPLFPKRQVFRGRINVVYRPMFPGYMFVQLGANQDWHRLETAPGIRVTNSLLSMGGNYATLSQDEVGRVTKKAKELCEQVLEEGKPRQFDVGDQVKINVGQFAGFLATIEALDDDERNIHLLTYLFRRQVRVKAKPEHLIAVA